MAENRDKLLEQVVLLDMEYQRMLIRAKELEPEYDRILTTLPKEDRELLERYIALCEEMDHRILMLVLGSS